MDDCLFCNIISGDVPSYKVYEDESTYAFLDIFPVTKGHTLVVPKSHAYNLLEGTDDEICSVMKTVKKIAPSILEAVGANDFNLHSNVGEQAGQSVFHTHIHIIPRLAGDGLDMWSPNPLPSEEMRALHQQIVDRL